jgi:hypothetical protein
MSSDLGGCPGAVREQVCEVSTHFRGDIQQSWDKEHGNGIGTRAIIVRSAAGLTHSEAFAGQVGSGVECDAANLRRQVRRARDYPYLFVPNRCRQSQLCCH